MSFIESAKKVLNGIEQLSEKEYVLNRISKILRLLAAVVLVSIFLEDELNLENLFSLIDLNLWNDAFRFGLKSYIYYVGIFWIIYGLIISNILKVLCGYFDKTENKKSIPVLFTVNDFIDFICSLYFFTYSINQLIELNNTIINDNMIMSIVAGVYLLVEFIRWIYIKNSNNWYRINKEYTNYYDVNNKRIPQNANVIYRSKLYRVYWSGDVFRLNQEDKKLEWRLCSWEDHDSISLEEAVSDRDGNLTIETWKNRYGMKE